HDRFRAEPAFDFGEGDVGARGEWREELVGEAEDGVRFEEGDRDAERARAERDRTGCVAADGQDRFRAESPHERTCRRDRTGRAKRPARETAQSPTPEWDDIHEHELVAARGHDTLLDAARRADVDDP